MARFLVGLLEGEGIGPQLIDGCVALLEALGVRFGHRFDCRYGGVIGTDAVRRHGTALSAEVVRFCEDLFAAGAPVLAGAGGGRFVYDLRRVFDLFYKVNPLHGFSELMPPGHGARADFDVLVLRENLGGLYQGEAEEVVGPRGRAMRYTLTHTAADVRRFLDVAFRLAEERRGRLHLVLKPGGLPEVTRFWVAEAEQLAAGRRCEWGVLEVDYAAYRLLREPESLDVLAAPNCFGDILADLGGHLGGSRGLTYGGSFSATGAAVYQTNHGAAYDLAGTDRANPVGQMLALAYLLRESLELPHCATAIERAIRDTWAAGYVTEDLAAAGGRVVSTSELTRRIADRITNDASDHEAAPVRRCA